MRNRKKQKANRALGKALAREKAREACLDHDSGSRGFRDPTAGAAIEAADRALADRRKKQAVASDMAGKASRP